MHFVKTSALIVLTVLIISLFAGCMTKSIDELYSVPQPEDEYVLLQQSINQVLQKGAEYASPVSGSYRQSVQLYDFDDDGTEEALAFFRVTGDKPLRICIFRNNGGEYENVTTIEGEGTSIESIDYRDLDGDGKAEIIVGWTMSGDIRMLGVYSLRNLEAVPLMLTDYYEYIASDMDSDERADLTIVRHDRTAKYGSAETYFFRSDGEIESSSAKLSAGLETVERVRSGKLSDGCAAVLVEGTIGGSVVTDIVTLIDGLETNITADSKSGISECTMRNYSVYSSDINGDGYVDVPMPQNLPEQSEETVYRIINWYNYSSRGMTTKAISTYHNYTDGWYLILPNEWLGKLAIRREDRAVGERSVIFSEWRGENTPARDFLVIYTLTGVNREDRAGLDGRVRLSTGGETIFAAEVLDEMAEASETDIISRFRIIYSEWMTESD